MRFWGFRSKALLCLALAAFALPEQARACVCKSASIEQRIDRADYIFVARIVSSTEVKDGQNLTLDRHMSVKGSPLKHVVVDYKSCPMSFKTNRYYVFYAKDSDERQYPITDLCMGTKESSFSAEELRQLFTK